MDTPPRTTATASSLASGSAHAPPCIVSDSEVLGGMPAVLGTRVPAATLVAYLRDGCPISDITENYPTLPPAWLTAVEDWTLRKNRPDWRTALPNRPA